VVVLAHGVECGSTGVGGRLGSAGVIGRPLLVLVGAGRGEAGAKQVRDSVVERVPLKVASTADDIAQLVCFLASPASSNMTGELVRMDAGMHLIM